MYYKWNNTYGCYISGDLPFERFDSDVKNNRRLVVIKNSFGNALVPHLVQNFETVFVIDYRYFNGSVYNLIKSEKITDVLFPIPAFSSNTISHIQRIKSILKYTKSDLNSTKKDVVSQVANDFPQGAVFKIQFCSSKVQLDSTSYLLKNIQGYIAFAHKNYFMYLIGNTKSYTEAESIRQKMIEKGYSDAVIRVFVNDKLIK